MIERDNLSKFGMGTWGIGGFVNKCSDNNDAKQISALCYMLENGINFIEAGLWAADGYSAYLTSLAYKQTKIKREKIFLTQSIYHYKIENMVDLERQYEDYASLFETDYIDAIQFDTITIKKLGYEKIVYFVRKYLSEGRTRFVSVTNSNLKFLREFHKIFGDKLFAHELGFNFEIRENEELGIIDYAIQKGVLNVVYQPLRRNKTALKNYPLLIELSNKYGKTQNQIIFNWIVRKGLFPISKSENLEHIKELLASFDFVIEHQDFERLNKFRVPGYQSPIIDWYREGQGVPVDQLSNLVDDFVKNDEFQK